MLTKFQLLPEPRQVEFLPVEFSLPARTLIRLDGDPQLLRFAASRVQDLISTHFNFDWQTTASWAVPPSAISLTLRLAPDEVPHPQGYQLTVTPAGITIKGHDPAGIFYGVCTLNQIFPS
jgi:hexosaminidase